MEETIFNVVLIIGVTTWLTFFVTDMLKHAKRRRKRYSTKVYWPDGTVERHETKIYYRRRANPNKARGKA